MMSLAAVATRNHGLFLGSAVFFLVLNAALLLAELLAPELSATLDANHITPVRGAAFSARVRGIARFPYRITTETLVLPPRVRLDLYEDGVLLGPPRSAPALVYSRGAGAYLLWHDTLLFSSSDGTDPRSNGRSYSIRAVPEVYWRVSLAAVCGLIASVWLAFPIRVSYLIRRLLTPVRAAQPWVGGAAALLAVMVAVALVVESWVFGPSRTLAVAGYLPVSDALGYQTCATTLAAAGKFGYLDWCSRRALYPAMLAGVLVASGWYGQVALLLQAAVLGLAILAVSVEAARLLGRLAGAIVFVALFVFAREFALSAFVTEVAGLSAGLAGLALLLRYAATRRQPWLLAGLALLSIGMTARAGALLVLPALGLWGWLLSADASPGRRGRAAVSVVLAALAGPLLHTIVLLALDIDPRNTGGNFAASLYGLSTGTRDWSQAYRDLGHLIQEGEAEGFRQIYLIALDNIRAAPGVFLTALAQAGKLYATSLFQFGALTPVSKALTMLLLAGLLTAARRWRTPLGSLLLLAAAGELASAPLIMDSGGHRVFAASVALRVLLAALGLQALLALLARRLAPISPPREDHGQPDPGGGPLLPLALGGLLVLAMLLPVTPVARLFRLDPLPGLGCPSGLTEVVTRLGLESQTLSIVALPSEAGFIPFRIISERLRTDTGLPGDWYGPDFWNLPEGTMIVRALQRSQRDFGTMHHLVLQRNQPNQQGGVVSLCVDPEKSVSLAEVPHLIGVTSTPIRSDPGI